MDKYIDSEKYDRCVEDIGELLQKTVRTLQMLEREQIRIHGFTSSQCYLLVTLLRNGSLTINEISRKMRLEISTITRIMDNLVRDGLLIRQRTAADKRVVEAFLTEKGQTTAKLLQNGIDGYYRSVISHLPRGRVREIMGAMECLVDALEISRK